MLSIQEIMEQKLREAGVGDDPSAEEKVASDATEATSKENVEPKSEEAPSDESPAVEKIASLLRKMAEEDSDEAPAEKADKEVEKVAEALATYAAVHEALASEKVAAGGALGKFVSKPKVLGAAAATAAVGTGVAGYNVGKKKERANDPKIYVAGARMGASRMYQHMSGQSKKAEYIYSRLTGKGA
jgi:hypothetical protein